MKKFWLFGMLVIAGLLFAGRVALTQKIIVEDGIPVWGSGFSLGLEQEFWATEMELVSDPFYILDYLWEYNYPWTYFEEWVVHNLTERDSFHRTFLRGTFHLTDRLDLYGKVGTARLYQELKWMRGMSRHGEYYYEELDWIYEYWTEGTYIIDPWWWIPIGLGLKESESGSAWGVGSDFTLASSPNCSAVFNLEYLSQENSNLGSFLFEETDIYPDTTTETYIYRYHIEHKKASTTQLTASIIGKAHLGRFSPYAGVRYTLVESKKSGTGTYSETELEDGQVIWEDSWPVDFDYTMRNKDPWGFIGGCEFQFNKKWSGNVCVIVQGDWGVSVGVERRM